MTKTLNLSLGALVAALAMMLALAVPAGAQSLDNNDCNGVANCNTVTTDNSRDQNGNCNIRGVDQEATVVNDQTNDNQSNGPGDDGSQQSNNANNSASNSVMADCSVHNHSNVTNVHNAAAAAEKEHHQVAAPQGGVKAGAGGAVGTSLSALLGLGASLSAVGAGLRLRKSEV